LWEKKFQLILSRKHPDLLAARQNDAYGFTLVRKHTISVDEEKQGYKSSWCEYGVDETEKHLHSQKKNLILVYIIEKWNMVLI